MWWLCIWHSLTNFDCAVKDSCPELSCRLPQSLFTMFLSVASLTGQSQLHRASRAICQNLQGCRAAVVEASTVGMS